MQSPIRRYLIVGGSAFLVLALVFFTLRTGRGDRFQSTCEKFISYVVAQNADKSYDMFSDSVRANLSKTGWTEKMKVMQPSHYEATATLKASNDFVPPSTDTSKATVPHKQLQYFIKSSGLTSVGTCTVIHDDGYAVDAYTIAPYGGTGE